MWLQLISQTQSFGQKILEGEDKHEMWQCLIEIYFYSESAQTGIEQVQKIMRYANKNKIYSGYFSYN